MATINKTEQNRKYQVLAWKLEPLAGMENSAATVGNSIAAP